MSSWDLDGDFDHDEVYTSPEENSNSFVGKLKRKIGKHKVGICALFVIAILVIIIFSLVVTLITVLATQNSGDDSKNNNDNNNDNTTTTSTPNVRPSISPSATPSPIISPLPDSEIDPLLLAYWETLAAQIHTYLNVSVDPCNDFYEYACGGWVEQQIIPEGEEAYYKSFDTIDDYVNEVINSIINADWPMIGTFYSNCMDMERRDQIGGKPLIPFLEEINDVSGYAEISALFGKYQSYSIACLFDIDVSPDLDNPSIQNFEVDQGGMGLPDVSYYFMEDSYGTDVQTAYKIFITRALQFLSNLTHIEEDSETSLSFVIQAENIYNFEKSLASISNSTQERRDILALYNIYPIDGLGELTGEYIDWEIFLRTIELNSSISRVNVVNPFFFQNLPLVMQNTSFALLKNYVRWKVISGTSSILNTQVLDMLYDYVDTVYGTNTPPPLNETCLKKTNSMLGMLIGRYFIQEVWDEEYQIAAENLISAIESSFHSHLPDVAWMDEDTTVQAEVKLSKVIDKIGYPSVWPDINGLIIYPNDFYNNSMEGRKFYFAKEIAEAPLPTDPEKWDMFPQTVNAYYDPQENEMVFPAAILMEPMFSKRYPTPMNFGGIGSVMGHELTHGFDDQGRQFDGDGRFRNWWTPESSQNYDQQAQCVIDLYSEFEIEDGVYVDGAQTEGENIADMGGVKDSFRALLFTFPSQNYRDNVERIFGMTFEQLFFVSYGQVWCAKVLPEYEEFLALVDVHSPPKARVNNPLSQFSGFSDTFSCPVDSPMNPSTKCEVW